MWRSTSVPAGIYAQLPEGEGGVRIWISFGTTLCGYVHGPDGTHDCTKEGAGRLGMDGEDRSSEGDAGLAGSVEMEMDRVKGGSSGDGRMGSWGRGGDAQGTITTLEHDCQHHQPHVILAHTHVHHAHQGHLTGSHAHVPSGPVLVWVRVVPSWAVLPGHPGWRAWGGVRGVCQGASVPG